MSAAVLDPNDALPHAFRAEASDGYSLGGLLWHRPEQGRARKFVLIVPATSVCCTFYSRFAEYLFSNGYDVATFDYRGIGFSRPADLRGFQADWVDWGAKDVEAILAHIRTLCPACDISIVAHSIGGFTVGMAPSAAAVRRIVTVAAQYAYWRDYHSDHRLAMLLRWHVAMPLMTALYGYFPGKRLGWLEDTPAGIVRDWTRMGPDFERALRKNLYIGGEREGDLLKARLARITAPILAISFEDDPFGTKIAIERLLRYFTGSEKLRRRMSPTDIGESAIGHFGFFQKRFGARLWPIALAFLNEERQHREDRQNDGLS
ncbi:MAG TPA: alpha/beta fold hydrolase [Rhabdaerophilum sp.]|nr:alpha/beta fold hydrolase [Rhabdaerophilum sp.]